MTEPTKLEVFRLMERIGGSFASALATAWIKADLENQRKIENAFPEFVRDYTEMYKAGHGVSG